MMSCDDFLKILVEQGGGKDEATKAAFEEHRGACEDCRMLVKALGEYERVMREPKTPRADDPVKAKVMAHARDHIAREQLAEAVGELTRKPAPIVWLRPLAAAALLLVFAGGFVAGRMVEPAGPRVSLSESHLEAAKLLKKLGDDGWRKHAEAVVADPNAAPADKKEATELLRK